MAASKTIGGINVTISATVQPLEKAIKRGIKVLNSFTSSIKNTIFSMKGLVAALTTGAAATAFTRMVSGAMESIDALGELSDKLGVNTKSLAAFQLAAQEAGVSNETLERALVTLNKKGLGGEHGFRKWIEDTAKLSTHQEKLAAATQMFGSRGSSMVRMLTGGTAALDEAKSAAESLGLALDRASVTGVERALDAFARMKSAVGGIFKQIAIDIAPYLEVLSNKLTGFLAEGGRGKSIGNTVADAMISTTKMIADGFQSLFASLKTLIGDMDTFVSNAKKTVKNEFTGAPFKKTGGGLLGLWDSVTGSMGTMFGAARGPMSFRPVASRGGTSSGTSGPTPWSEIIQKGVDEARKLAAAQAATAPGNVGENAGLLNRILGGAGKGILGDIKNLPNTIGGPQFQMFMRAQAMAWKIGLTPRRHLDKDGFTVGTGAAAQDPLSREGFAQRVRSLQQNSLTKVANQQLVVQKQIRDAIKNQPGMAPLNLAGA